VALLSAEGGKVVILAGMTKDVVDRGLRANELVSFLSRELGGGGGGRPDIAQGGGVRVDAIPTALQKAAAWITERAGKQN
jgi:alanyl-tRNA synthetase